MGWRWGDTQVTLGPSAWAGLWQGEASGHPPRRHVCTCKKALCSSHPQPGISCSQVQGAGGLSWLRLMPQAGIRFLAR